LNRHRYVTLTRREMGWTMGLEPIACSCSRL
jgi:hypothetical protein